MFRAEIIGDWITADHKVLRQESGPRDNHRYAVVVQDFATQWIQSYPCKTKKTSQETQRSLQKFLEPTRNLKVMYTDNSLEFGKSCEELFWNHCTSTQHRWETNGIAERAVRRVKEGTSAVLLQSCLDIEWWANSTECHCQTRNIQDKLSDGETPFRKRFGVPFNGPVMPFGAPNIIPFLRNTSRDCISVWSERLANIFLGCAFYARGIWKGDIIFAHIEELEEMVASELHARRLTAKEVLTPMKVDNFFPIADGTVKKSFRENSVWEHPPQSGIAQNEEKNKKFLMVNLMNYILQPCSRRLNAGWSPIPLKVIDVTRATHTSLDVVLENMSTMIGTLMEIEKCQIRGQVPQDSLYRMKNPPERLRIWSSRRLSRKQGLQTRHFVARDVERHVRSVEAKRKAKVAYRITEARQCQKIAWYLLVDPEIRDIMKNARNKLEVPMASAMPCKIQPEKFREYFRVEKDCKTKYACTDEARESTRNRLQSTPPKDREDHIARKGYHRWPLTIWFINSFRCRKRWKFRTKENQFTRNGRISRQFQTQLDTSEARKNFLMEAHRKSPLCHLDGHLSSQEGRVRINFPEIHISSRAPRRCWQRLWILCSVHRARFLCISNDGRNGYHLQIARLRWTSSRRSIGLHPSENGRCSQIIENSKIGVSRQMDSSTTTQMAKIMVQYGRPSRSSWAKSVWSPFGRSFMGKAIRESSNRTRLGKVLNWECLFVKRARGLLQSV